MDFEEVLNKSEDFASIDELLDEDNEEELTVKEKLSRPLTVPSQVKIENDPIQASESSKPVENGVFSSGALDEVIDSGLLGAVNIPSNLAMEGITLLNEEEMEKMWFLLDESEGLRAGLGNKLKSRMRMMMRMTSNCDGKNSEVSKVRTLAMKRIKLQEDILKFGVAAIEKIYPRQTKIPVKRKSLDSRPFFKMKPVPNDMKFEEIEARSLLKPLSHHKYIRQPDTPSVVFIHRKEGLFPLSTLSKGARTLLSSNVRLLAGRNVCLCKPGHFVRDRGGRVVAVGGTRRKENMNIKIVQVPSFEKDVDDKMSPFVIDDEFAAFAAPSVKTNTISRIDFRELRKQQKERAKEIDTKLSEGKSNLEKMILKLNYKVDDEMEDNDQYKTCMAAYKDLKLLKKCKQITEQNTSVKQEDQDEFKSLHVGRKNYCDSLEKSVDTSGDTIVSMDTREDCNEQDTVDNSLKEDIEVGEKLHSKVTVHNQWDSTPSEVIPKELNIDECPPLRGYSESSIKIISRTPLLNFDGYTGYDNCDITDCFCAEKIVDKSTNDNSLTEFGTPSTGLHSGSQTPSGSKRPQKIAKDLLRVKRALKTLGVKIIEFDDDDGCEDGCQKDYCKLGCICDSLRTKQIPPSHCGKVECMFSCCCSKEALKYSSCGSRRVNISAAVGARIQEDSQRNMAVEERKFTNTVVVTSDKDAVVLGGTRTGRGTRRERKLPQRYQNSQTLMLDVAGKEYVEKEVSSESDEEYEEEKVEDSFEDLKRSEDIIPCTVIIPKIPLPKSCEVWCMYHCQYSCPCYRFKSPLDYGPDKNLSRNVAERTLGNKFSKKRKKSGERLGTVNKDSLRSPETEAPLLGIEDIDPDWNATSESNLKEDTDIMITETIRKADTKDITEEKTKFLIKKGQCARTQGSMFIQSLRTKLPHKPAETNPLPDLEEVICVSDPPSKITDKSPKISKEKIEISDQLSVEIAPKFSTQHVRWDWFKGKFHQGTIDLWFWVRPGRGKNVVFLTSGGTQPYIASAINIRNLQGSTQNLPGLVDECLKSVRPQDQGLYAVLQSNGRVWTLGSIQANKDKLDADQVKAITARLTALSKPKDKHDPTAGEPLKLKDGAVKVSLAEEVQKLPVGQSLITVTGTDSKAMMQVKLPPTQSTQYWSLISVGQGRSSIQCPDSSLVLKCAILQQAATLATATSTTVRIPIPVGDQDPSFGVYAVPGLKSHVFVGPFASEEDKSEDQDVVCLEDENNASMKEVDKENKNDDDDDDVQILDPKDKDVMEIKERRKKLKILKEKSKQLGQLPHKLTKDDSDADVDIIESSTESTTKSQSIDLKRENIKTVSEEPIYAMFSSDYGRVVKNQNQQQKSSRQGARGAPLHIKQIIDGKENIFDAILEPSGKIIMQHPQFPNHEVICTSVQRAKLWLREFFDKNINNDGDKQTEDRKPVLPLVLKKIKTPSLPSGRSTENISLFTMPSKQQKDEAELFYELGHTAFTSFFQRNITRVQILTKAKEEIEKLERDGKELEMSKAGLLKKRAKLFDDFTKSLNGLPVAKKKVAVIELKERLKGVQDQRNKDVDTDTSFVKIKSEPNNETSSTPYTDATGIKTLRPDGSVLRPMNAFMLWAKDRRVEMISKGMSVSQVSQELSEQWKTMSEEEKGQYYRDAEHLKSLHRLQHPDYKYSPHIVKNTTAAPSPSRVESQQVSPNQPPDRHEEEPQIQPLKQHIQPPNMGRIQVPKPLPQLRNQSIIISKPKPSQRPTPGLIPVQKLAPKSREFEVLNIPSVSSSPRPNIKITSTFTPQAQSVSNVRRISGDQNLIIRQQEEMLVRLDRCQDMIVQQQHQEYQEPEDALRTEESRVNQEQQKQPVLRKDQQQGVLLRQEQQKELQVIKDETQVVIVGQDQQQRMPIEQDRQRQDEQVPVRQEQPTSFLRRDQFSDQGTLNMMDIPQDAADVLGLAVQSSGLEEIRQQPQQRSQPQQLLQEPQQLPQSQLQQLQQQSQSQQFVIEGGEVSQLEQQFIQIGGDNYQLVDNNQDMEEEEEPVFVDELGRQVILSPEQQQLLREQQQLIDQDHQIELVDEEMQGQEHDQQDELVGHEHNQQVQLVGQEHDQQVLLVGQEHDQQVQLVGQEHDQQVQLVGQEHLQRVLEEQMLQHNDQQPVFVDEDGRQIILTPEQQIMLQNQHLMLEGQQLMMDEGGQPVLITYQQSEDDVMTID